MAPLRPLLILALLAWVALADQESCKGRCTEGFNANKKCQCDELCSYYQSCCTDYVAECKPQVTRGDVFTMPEDEYAVYDDGEEKNNATVHEQLGGPSLTSDLQAQPEGNPEQAPVLNPEEEAPAPEVGTSKPEWMDPKPGTLHPGSAQPAAEEELCSGKPFDAFTDLKNGSLFAFRGQYCYELDEKAVRPGYPKLIQDVWGIEGPIDAAFTRINCQGKTYLFRCQGLWARASRRGWGRDTTGTRQPQFISRDWHGVPGQVDAAMAGHIYISGMAPRPSLAKKQKFRRRNRKGYRSHRGHSRGRDQNSRRPSRATWLSLFSSEESNLGANNYDDYRMDWLVPATCEPIQSVFFFSGDKYYRVNLRTRRVDTVDPPYPRSIAQYWLGCPAPGHL
uniref:Vitronectin n=1 Tax=Nomascus leucogenys TaxID=61853 RepID=G1QNN4_NOMLE